MVARDLATPGGHDPDAWSLLQAGRAIDEMQSRSWPGTTALVSGTAEGMLYGGCLSMLVASLGTPYEIQTEGTILYLEDVNTRPYQLDRMLMHLKLAGKFSGVRALLFGPMTSCAPEPGQAYTLQEVIIRVVRELGIPVGFGFPSGHVEVGNTILPFGVHAKLTVDSAVAGAVRLQFETPLAAGAARVEAAQ
jgi:muramoyltetrapeptide carboxypeptidase